MSAPRTTTPSKRKRGSAVPIEGAIEVFVRGFSFTRSFTHPYIASRAGPLWVMRDGPRTSGDSRKEEWVAYGVPPADVDRIVRRGARGRFAICAIRDLDQSPDEMRDAYVALGYRLMTTEPMMVQSLRNVPRLDGPFPVERVTTRALADRLARAARSRQVLPEHLSDDDAPMRQYAALDGERPIGWARSIVVGNATWLSSVYVVEAYRRRGIGRSLMSRILLDDVAHGARASVLLASHTGSKLYASVGFEQIAELMLFVRKKPAR